MGNHWEHLWHRWAPAVWTAPVMLAAYVGLAIAAPTTVQTTVGMVTALAAATLLVSLLVGWLSRVLGVYRANRHIEGTPQRQGITASQLAVIALWFIYPRMGIEHSLVVYAATFVVVGLIGALTLSLIAGRDAANHTTTPTHHFEHATRGPTGSTRVAPSWAQRTAALLLVFGVVSFVRLFTDGTMHFLWGGIVLLASGALLPSLVVMLGGGVEPPQ